MIICFLVLCQAFKARLLYEGLNGVWHLRLSAKILALLRLSVKFFQLRLTIKLKINLFVSKSELLMNLYSFVSLKQKKCLRINS